MNKPITALEAMAKLKAAYPNEYVTINVEIAAVNQLDGTRIDTVHFSCYAASREHCRASTLDAALAGILAMAPGSTPGDAPTEIDRLNSKAHDEAIVAANTAEATYPEMKVEEVAP